MDYIPLSENSMKRSIMQQSPTKKRKKLTYSHVFDVKLLQRVREYLEENKDKVYIDIEDITSDLQKKYLEYRRKQVKPFMKCVEQAYTKVKKQLADNDPALEDLDFEETIQSVMEDTVKNDDDSIADSTINQTVIHVNESSKQVKGKSKLKTKSKHNLEAVTSNLTFKDFAGNEKCLEDVCKLLAHLKHPEIFKTLGISPPHGILLHGPPGSGKTLLAHAMAGELSVPLMKLGATEIVSGVSGESEEKIRDIFQAAKEVAPCLLFLDEIDAISGPRQTAQREMERRIVAQLLNSLDEVHEGGGPPVLVVGATNRPDSLDPALRRAGRFDREISLGIPNESGRKKILEIMCREVRVNEDVSLENLARFTPGYVGADLKALVREACLMAVDRAFKNDKLLSTSDKLDITQISQNGEESTLIIIDNVGDSTLTSESFESANSTVINVAPSAGDSTTNYYLKWIRKEVQLDEAQLDNLTVCMDDFQKALKLVQPSAKREGFATVPNVTWEDVGALKEVKDELKLAIMAPITYKKQCDILGLKNPSGILLYGPPGCGKTLLAKAVSNEAGINFISVKGPELLNMYVGESERAVRQCFLRAKNSSPCVIFFDEIDSLCPKRSDSSENASSSRVVNQMLTEMDGMEERCGVFLMAATNRLDIIDPAIIRPGRLDKIIYVGLPTAKERFEIVKTITKNGTQPPISKDISLKEIAEDSSCDGYTGADLVALIREASLCALKEYLMQQQQQQKKEMEVVLQAKHFASAFSRIRASVSSKEQRRYAQLRDSYAIPGPAKEVATAISTSHSEARDLRNDTSFRSHSNEPDEITID